MSRNSDWKKIFDKYNVLDQIERTGLFRISATQIKEFHEPRLMTKFDHSSDLPDLFKKHNLAILPVTRGDYIISTFSNYKSFEDDVWEPDEYIDIPDYIQSLSPSMLFSESVALNYAAAAGVFENFLDDIEIKPTVNGRMKSDVFSFNIDTAKGKQTIDVKNSQIEIDSAYEGLHYLTLFEAKKQLAEDFLIRQLYYPYRKWSELVSKQIKTVFLIFSDGVFYLREYSFNNKYDYNSITLVKQKKYIISSNISSKEVQHYINNTSLVREPDISFPQADSFERVINLIELLADKELSSSDITDEYQFVSRQSDYYANAARYLGLVEKSANRGGEYRLTAKGNHVMALPLKERKIELIKCIVSHKPFKEVAQLFFENGYMPKKDEIINIMKNCILYNVNSESTFYRRASTISSWVNWIAKQIDD